MRKTKLFTAAIRDSITQNVQERHEQIEYEKRDMEYREERRQKRAREEKKAEYKAEGRDLSDEESVESYVWNGPVVGKAFDENERRHLK